jgi:hypothetical protein
MRASHDLAGPHIPQDKEQHPLGGQILENGARLLCNLLDRHGSSLRRWAIASKRLSRGDHVARSEYSYCR